MAEVRDGALKDVRVGAPMIKKMLKKLGGELLAFAVAACLCFSGGRAFGSAPPLRGMTLGLFDREIEKNHRQALLELKALGVNAVLLVVNWYQHDIRSDVIEARRDPARENFTPSDATLTQVIAEAHRLKMQVLLFPYLRFDQRKPGEWRGSLAPRDFARWSEQYERFILYYAELAQKNRVELLSIGSEMSSLETRGEFWQSLIAKVRRRYSGQLLYSANWDHYSYPVFWNDLDFIGMTAYYPLSRSSSPTQAELVQAWKRLKKKILAFQGQYPQKKLIFAEVGYPSLKGASRTPWNYLAATAIDLEEQALCYRAFIEAWQDTPVLAGVFWWAWYGQGGVQDRGYTPRGKTAEAWLREWYRGSLAP